MLVLSHCKDLLIGDGCYGAGKGKQFLSENVLYVRTTMQLLQLKMKTLWSNTLQSTLSKRYTVLLCDLKRRIISVLLVCAHEWKVVANRIVSILVSTAQQTRHSVVLIIGMSLPPFPFLPQKTAPHCLKASDATSNYVLIQILQLTVTSCALGDRQTRCP